MQKHCYNFLNQSPTLQQQSYKVSLQPEEEYEKIEKTFGLLSAVERQTSETKWLITAKIETDVLESCADNC